MNTPKNNPSTLQKLSKLLNLSEQKLIIAIRQMGLNPNEADESWVDPIRQHLRGEKPQAIKGTKPETPDTPESFSIEDSEADFVDWDEVVQEFEGDESQALALIKELELEPEAITRSDLVALKELALINPVAEDMVNVRFV